VIERKVTSEYSSRERREDHLPHWKKRKRERGEVENRTRPHKKEEGGEEGKNVV